MMKMDRRDSAECQNWEKNDINVIFGKFNEWKKTKLQSCFFSKLKDKERCSGRGTVYVEAGFVLF